MDKLIKNELFWGSKRRRQFGLATRSSAGTEVDPYKRLFGTAVPATIPESTAWWKIQQKNLCAICDEAELGLMTLMVARQKYVLSKTHICAIAAR